MNRWIPLWLVVLLASLLSSAATAQGGKSTAQQLEAIRERMETGLALFVGGKAPEAAAQFDAGYAEQPYSAFLFNAAVCYQKMGNVDKALERYREYVRIDPNAPDIDKVQERIAALEGQGQAPPPPPPPPDAGLEGAPPPPLPPPPALEAIPDTEDAMRSLVVVETEPPGAPLKVFRTEVAAPTPFQYGGANPQWKEIVTTVSPTSLSLSVGRYHVVIDKFRDFHVSETDIVVRAGHVHHFKANLSQGVFMSFLRVAANVKGAHVWLDDLKKARPEWGTTPYGELVPAGPHKVLIEAPGFQPLATDVELVHGEQKELEVRLVRVDYGVVRLDANAPEVKVRIDGEPKGVWRSGEAALDIQTSSGKHQLIVESSGHKTLEAMIDVPKGQVLPVHAKMIPKYPRGAAWTQAILAAAFIGAGAFFGDQSNRLNDQVETDKKAGVLEEDDGRITRGRIYAIGADGAFVVGGVLAILSTYNFIKDPLPESSKELDTPVEFEDPLAKRPTASLTPPRPSNRRHAERSLPKEDPPRPPIRIGPQVSDNGAGFFVGGSF